MDALHPSLQIPTSPRASPAQLDTNLMESSPPPTATTKDSSATLLALAPCTIVELIALLTELETPSRVPNAQLQPSAMVELQTAPLNSAQKGLKVYSRRRSRKTTSCAIHVSLAPSGAVTPLMAEGAASQHVEAQIPPTQQPPSAGRDMAAITQRDLFLSNLVSNISSILHVPITTRQRTEAARPRSTPRRSCRIAGAGVELPMGELTRRSTKQAMKALKVIDENGSVDRQAEEDCKNIL
jgi:hypothetical protein